MNEAPARELAGKRHSAYSFNDFAVDAVDSHNPEEALFMYLAPASAHTPLEPPPEFLALYPADWNIDRRQYAGLCSTWDSLLPYMDV